MVLSGSPIVLADAPDCLSCHPDKTENPITHAPIKKRQCSACHQVKFDQQPPGQSGVPHQVTTKADDAVCYTCHERKDKLPSTHTLLKSGNSCTACHDPHGSENGTLLRTPRATICLSCHADHAAPEKGRHAALDAKRGCLTCHMPHSGSVAPVLIKSTGALCFNCHDQELESKRTDGPKKVANIRALIKESPFIHAPAREPNGCAACHNPHRSALPRLLKMSFPVGHDYNKYIPDGGPAAGTYALCFQCHDPAMLNKTITGTETKFRDGKKNLHWFHVVDAAGSPDKDRGRSCAICHDPHASSQPHLIRNGWPMSASFTLKLEYQTRKSGATCTRSCHESKPYTNTP